MRQFSYQVRSFTAAATFDLQLPVSRHGVRVVFVEALDTISGCNVSKLRSWHFRTEGRLLGIQTFHQLVGPSKALRHCTRNLRISVHVKDLLHFCTAINQSIKTLDAQASLGCPDRCLRRDGRPSTPVLCNAEH